MELNISEAKYNEIRKNIMFFISDERMYTSTLYEMIRMSPGKWFDIEELALRNSIKKICTNLLDIQKIIKKIDELEYNEMTGQIRLKSPMKSVEDIVNEKTVLFYGIEPEFNEDKLLNIIDQNKLKSMIVRFLKFSQLKRRDLSPIYPILKNKVDREKAKIVILKMENRIEAIKIKNIVLQLYPQIGCCLAITNFLANGTLSLHHTIDYNIPLVYSSNSINNILKNTENTCIIISNYIYGANEYAVILDHLIENKLKPNIYRNFVECRSDTNFLRKNLIIPESYIGCFSIITYDKIKDVDKAIELIKQLIPTICVQKK